MSTFEVLHILNAWEDQLRAEYHRLERQYDESGGDSPLQDHDRVLTELIKNRRP